MTKSLFILETIAEAEKANGAFEPISPLEREQIDYLNSKGLITDSYFTEKDILTVLSIIMNTNF